MPPIPGAKKQSRKHHRIVATLNKEKRQEKVADLYCKGFTQAQIADETGVSVPTIHKDIKEIRERWVESCNRAFDVRLSELLARLDLVEREAWAAFARSCMGTETVKSGSEKELRTPLDEEGNPTHPEMVEIRRTDNKSFTSSAGDPKFLEIIHKSIETRLRAMGAFDKENQGGNTNNTYNISWDVLVQHVNVNGENASSGTPPLVVSPEEGLEPLVLNAKEGN